MNKGAKDTTKSISIFFIYYKIPSLVYLEPKTIQNAKSNTNI